MIKMKALGVNWNKMDPFVRYGPTDFPVIAAPPLYNYPVITEPASVVVAPTTPATSVPNWVLVGGAIVAGVALATLLMRKS